MDINKLSFTISGSSSRARTSLEKLIVTLNKLDGAFTSASDKGMRLAETLNLIGGASSGLKAVSAQMTTVGSATKMASVNMKTAQVATKGLSTQMGTLHTRTANTSSMMTSLIRKITQITFVIYVARRALQAFGVGIQNAIAYVENLNLFMVALGENTSRATGFIKEMSESLYLDEAQLTRVQGLFYQISNALGLSSEKAYTLSENFTKLAYDLASFYNITIEDAVTKLQAGLVGETEPLRRIGIIITENNLAETARNLGIKKSIRNMTEMEKIQLRYVTALQQTRNAQGDLARTLEQPENLLRILREQFHVLMRELGNVAIPIIKELIPQVIGLVMALSKLARAFAETYGYDAPIIRDDLGGYMQRVANEVEDSEKATEGMAKNLAKILKYTKATESAMTGIDELNVIGDEGKGSALDNLFSTDAVEKDTSALDVAMGEYNNRMAESKGIFDAIILKWERVFTLVKETFGGAFDDTKKAFIELWEAVFGEGFDSEKVMGGIRLALDIIDGLLTGILTGVKNVYTKFESLWLNVFKPIVDAVAPNWLEWFQGQGFIDFVAKATEILLLWKTIKIAASAVTFIGGLAGFAKDQAGLASLTKMFGAMAAIQVAFKLAEAIDTGEWEKFGRDLVQALAVGLGIGAFLNPTAGVLAFNVMMVLDIDLGKAWRNLVQKGVDTFINPVIDAVVGTGEYNEKFINNIRSTYNIPKYAKGGYPDQGSLFIAGEAGPELVGHINGKTEVIPLYANGTPGADLISGKGLSEADVLALRDMGRKFPTTGFDAARITKDLNKIFGYIPKLFADLGKDIANSITITPTKGAKYIMDFFSFFKDRAKTFWEGLKGTDAFGGFINILGKAGKLIGKVGGGIGKGLATTFTAFAGSQRTQTIMGQAKGVGETTEQQQGIAKDVIGSLLGESVWGSLIFQLMDMIDSGLLGEFINSLPTFVAAGIDMIGALIQGVLREIPNLVAKLPVIIEQIVGFLTNKETLTMLINGFIDMIGAIVIALPDIISALVGAIPTIVSTLLEVLMDTFLSPEGMLTLLKIGWNLGVGIVEGLGNVIVAGLNTIIAIAEAPVRWLGITFPRVPEIDLSGLMMAEGGYPNQGQMFIAREAGAELVGNIGGRTGVMNNEQIVESVSRGVYQAVAQAMAEQGQKETVVNLDGRKMNTGLGIARKRSGASFGMEGY